MWMPHLTVAVVVEDSGRYLIVEELDNGERVLNQPAGHVEDGESITRAALREALEETCVEVELTLSLGISRYVTPLGSTYFRHSFGAKAIRTRNELERDPDILDVHWMSKDELISAQTKLRSPMVLNDIRRYEDQRHFPLEFYIES